MYGFVFVYVYVRQHLVVEATHCNAVSGFVLCMNTCLCMGIVCMYVYIRV